MRNQSVDNEPIIIQQQNSIFDDTKINSNQLQLQKMTHTTMNTQSEVVPLFGTQYKYLEKLIIGLEMKMNKKL